MTKNIKLYHKIKANYMLLMRDKYKKRYKKVKKFKMTKTFQANTNNENFNIKWKEIQIQEYIGKCHLTLAKYLNHNLNIAITNFSLPHNIITK